MAQACISFPLTKKAKITGRHSSEDVLLVELTAVSFA